MQRTGYKHIPWLKWKKHSDILQTVKSAVSKYFAVFDEIYK